jgi:hypothetical protein
LTGAALRYNSSFIPGRPNRECTEVKPTDCAKAAGVALLVLVIDVLIAVGVVFAWSIFVAPGHSRAYYQTAGIPVAQWSTRIAGTALIFGAAWLSAKRQPERNAYLFAVVLAAFYAILDGASVGFQGVFGLGFGLTILIKVIGSLAGAFAALRTASTAAVIGKGKRPFSSKA